MNLHCHAEVGLAPLRALADRLDPALLAAAERHVDCTGHFDRTLAEVQAMEPRWSEIIYSRDPGVLQSASRAAFAGEDLALLQAAAVRTLAAAAAGDRELAAMHLLLVSHLIADHCGTPAHICDLGLLDLLYDRPEAHRFANLHQLLETVPAQACLTGWAPALWRGDAGDAALAAVQESLLARDRTAKLVAPLLLACYADDEARARAITGEGVGAAARVFGAYAARVLAAAGWLAGALPAAPASHDLRLWRESDAILDFCCNFRPMVDGTLVYGEPGRGREAIVLGGRQRQGLCFIPLSPRAGAFPDHAAIPFAHDRCLGLVGWRINPARRYRLTALAGHNESVSRGGRIRVAAFSAGGGCLLSGALEPGEPVAIDLAVQGERVWLYGEDLDQSFPPLKYIAFVDPLLAEV